mmetsp:Transcript_29845/g.72635  ORF Transcript_29845/g.72635 Transcript_29845/m.72635 type:complete len:243 (-) Transcript_29845:162-890(-)
MKRHHVERVVALENTHGNDGLAFIVHHALVLPEHERLARCDGEEVSVWMKRDAGDGGVESVFAEALARANVPDATFVSEAARCDNVGVVGVEVDGPWGARVLLERGDLCAGWVGEDLNRVVSVGGGEELAVCGEGNGDCGAYDGGDAVEGKVLALLEGANRNPLGPLLDLCLALRLAGPLAHLAGAQVPHDVRGPPRLGGAGHGHLGVVYVLAVHADAAPPAGVGRGHLDVFGSGGRDVGSS